ncbi:hypothetical protein K6W26_08785 [Burkholderia sp. AU42008]|uniref:DUF6683 family protein n=1 Tax=unclassified Burkholderia TaxID=2613784 RepID=UPI0011774272|nr:MULTISPECIES: DUF6683 family protein [unclassified Burkholderia]MBR8233550.1 hypothetical protein [Burkholderia sp. AU32357]MBY4873165.1 hypothetical protein [Burkholderia sp. AU42008]
MRTGLRRLIAAALVGTYWHVPNAQAQYDAGASIGLGMGMTSNNNIIGGLNIGSQIVGRGAAQPPGPDAAAQQKLRFRPDETVHREVYVSIVDFLARRDPSRWAEAERYLAQSAPLAQFDRMLGSYALERNNLADVLVGYMVVTWEVVNATHARPKPEGIATLRAKMRAALARDSKISGMSDADKQRRAETFAYLAALAVAADTEMQRQGNQAGIAQLRQSVRRAAMQTIGVDVQGLRLAESGFRR